SVIHAGVLSEVLGSPNSNHSSSDGLAVLNPLRPCQVLDGVWQGSKLCEELCELCCGGGFCWRRDSGSEAVVAAQ
ncbi:uncharacterized protein CLUP02_01180, partial [Colletotrichum lupini]